MLCGGFRFPLRTEVCLCIRGSRSKMKPAGGPRETVLNQNMIFIISSLFNKIKIAYCHEVPRLRPLDRVGGNNLGFDCRGSEAQHEDAKGPNP